MCKVSHDCFRDMRQLFTLLTTVQAAVCRQGVHPVCGENFAAYNDTFLPNLLGQWSQNEIAYTASMFYPLRAVGCSEHLDLFLCSVLSPACVDDNPEGVLPFLVPVPPCQSLCHKVSNFEFKTDHRLLISLIKIRISS